MLFIINQHLNLTLTQMIHLTTNHPFVLPLMLLLMMSMHNPKTIIPTSLPTLYMLLIQQKHHPLMKHLFHPYHVFMITQAQTCLHHQEYQHHILQLHMPTIMLHQDNYHAPPPSPSSEHLKFVEALKEAHELSALLALHLAQRNLDPPSSRSPSSPHNINQLEKHVNNCPCCIFLLKTIAFNEHFIWIEYLLTRSHPIPSLEQHPKL